MRGGQLLLLAALVVLASCQQNVQVLIHPNLTQVYSGDFFYLSCATSSSGAVKWFFENQEQPHQTDKIWRIAAARPEQSGSYHCVVNSVQSDKVDVNVLGCMPRASLEIDKGQPVMRPGSSVTLQIENEDGLQGWLCWVYKGGKTKRIKLRLSNDTVRLPFSPTRLMDHETIFWCTDKDRKQRSNQIIVLTSDKPVSLEMYPFPALAGESVTLQCLVWGTDQISHVSFYVNASDLQDGRQTYEIQRVTKSAKGSYKCHAIYTYSASSEGPLRETSDVQVLEVYEIQMRAELSEVSGRLSCFCPLCHDRPTSVQYRWYKHNTSSSQWSLMLSDSSESMVPEKIGTYSCRAVWENGRSLLSKSYMHKHSSNPTILIVVIVIILLVALLVLAGAVRCHQQRQERGAIYEDMPLQSQGKQYEPLQRPHGSRPEAEYETLPAGAAGLKKDEGGYEALKKGEGQHEIYHTLQMEGAGSGTKEYEQLRGEGRKQEVYHTLHMQGAQSGTKDYEELRGEGRKQEVYHTLHMQGAESGAK